MLWLIHFLNSSIFWCSLIFWCSPIFRCSPVFWGFLVNWCSSVFWCSNIFRHSPVFLRSPVIRYLPVCWRSIPSRIRKCSILLRWRYGSRSRTGTAWRSPLLNFSHRTQKVIYLSVNFLSLSIFFLKWTMILRIWTPIFISKGWLLASEGRLLSRWRLPFWAIYTCV